MSEELLEFLKKNFGDLSQEQLMESFITHRISGSIFIIAIMSILLGLCAMAIVLCVHSLKTKSLILYQKEGREAVIWICAILSIIFTIVLCINIGTIIKCKAFPEKALYDSIKNNKFWMSDTKIE